MTKFTKNEIKRVFMKQLNEMPLDRISVKNLVKECGISRNTFYYHYHDIYEVLQEIFEEDVEKSLATVSLPISWEEGILHGVKLIIDNKKAIYHIYKSQDKGYVEAYLTKVSEFAVMAAINDISGELNVTREDKTIIAMFYTKGIMGVVEEWVEKGMKDDFEKMIKRLGLMLDGSIRLALNKAAEYYDK